MYVVTYYQSKSIFWTDKQAHQRYKIKEESTLIFFFIIVIIFPVILQLIKYWLSPYHEQKICKFSTIVFIQIRTYTKLPLIWCIAFCIIYNLFYIAYYYLTVVWKTRQYRNPATLIGWSQIPHGFPVALYNTIQGRVFENNKNSWMQLCYLTVADKIKRWRKNMT